jgi:hypothetical protein
MRALCEDVSSDIAFAPYEAVERIRDTDSKRLPRRRVRDV